MREWFQWVLLAAALAIPVLFFWNWKQRMTALAPAPSPSPGVRNPPAEAKAAPARKPPPPADARPAAPGDPRAPSAHAPGTGGGGREPPASAAGSTSVPASAAVLASTSASSGTPQGPGPKAAPKSRVTYSPKVDRDPMLSPFELERLMAKQKEAKEGPSKAKVAKKPPEPPIETRIRFSGTMRMGSEIVAYVNDQIVRVGSTILGAKVVKITEAAVVFEYKGRRFARTVRQ